jgi:hypothetical protein
MATFLEQAVVENLSPSVAPPPGGSLCVFACLAVHCVSPSKFSLPISPVPESTHLDDWRLGWEITLDSLGWEASQR